VGGTQLSTITITITCSAVMEHRQNSQSSRHDLFYLQLIKPANALSTMLKDKQSTTVRQPAAYHGSTP
jgi:hypothetical protein